MKTTGGIIGAILSFDRLPATRIEVHETLTLEDFERFLRDLHAPSNAPAGRGLFIFQAGELVRLTVKNGVFYALDEETGASHECSVIGISGRVPSGKQLRVVDVHIGSVTFEEQFYNPETENPTRFLLTGEGVHRHFTAGDLVEMQSDQGILTTVGRPGMGVEGRFSFISAEEAKQYESAGIWRRTFVVTRYANDPRLTRVFVDGTTLKLKAVSPTGA